MFFQWQKPIEKHKTRTKTQFKVVERWNITNLRDANLFKMRRYGRYVSHLRAIPDVDETNICIQLRLDQVFSRHLSPPNHVIDYGNFMGIWGFAKTKLHLWVQFKIFTRILSCIVLRKKNWQYLFNMPIDNSRVSPRIVSHSKRKHENMVQTTKQSGEFSIL